jgi:hypothetical protein
MPTTDINYPEYYNTAQWPSNSERNAIGGTVLVNVESMPPQRAASCLAILLTNARVFPVGDLQALDVDSREEYVRHTVLGHALAAKALGLNDIADVYALYSDTSDFRKPRPFGVSELLSDVFSMLVETNPLANAADIGRVAAAVVGDLVERYDYIPKED